MTSRHPRSPQIREGFQVLPSAVIYLISRNRPLKPRRCVSVSWEAVRGSSVFVCVFFLFTRFPFSWCLLYSIQFAMFQNSSQKENPFTDDDRENKGNVVNSALLYVKGLDSFLCGIFVSISILYFLQHVFIIFFIRVPRAWPVIHKVL